MVGYIRNNGIPVPLSVGVAGLHDEILGLFPVEKISN